MLYKKKYFCRFSVAVVLKMGRKKMLLLCNFRSLGWVSENQNYQYRSKTLDKILRNPSLNPENFNFF